MMKQALVVLALIGLGFAAPQPKKIFHEHFEDFMDIIIEDAGEELEHILEHYLEFEEFTNALAYIETNSFRDLLLEMESTPEFIAVVDFLEKDNIDIHYFIDVINEALGMNSVKKSNRLSATRHELSGTDISAFMNDCIAVFPKARLSALFDDKLANDEEFATTISNLQSDEWNQVFSALLDSESFKKEAAAFLENGIDVHIVFDEVMAIFGQN